jgi:hypothetical protein
VTERSGISGKEGAGERRVDSIAPCLCQSPSWYCAAVLHKDRDAEPHPGRSELSHVGVNIVWHQHQRSRPRKRISGRAGSFNSEGNARERDGAEIDERGTGRALSFASVV